VVRRCAATRALLPKTEMIRFVIGPERSLVPDLGGTLPGRGIWLSAKGDVIETARVRGTLQRALARAAGGSVAVPADLRERLAAGLERRIADLLGRAERSGQAAGAAPGRLADAVRADVARLAGVRGMDEDKRGTGGRGTDAAHADEGTGGRGA
jgi:predicted RNA-binding protein YlxR (DUF448 family)